MEKIKQSRAGSFIVVALVYILASAGGILIYKRLELPWWLALLVADVCATVFTFVFSVLFKNASVYDPYWSVQPIVILAAFLVGDGVTAFGLLLLFAVSFWGVRLTANWTYTFCGLKHQDWRYTMLCEKTGVFYPAINFLGIHMVPTLVVYACILPAVYAVVHRVELTPLGVIFLLVSVCAVVLQGVSDIQMHKFRKCRNGNFIRDGLWKYSRHPNYLGEILMWWGIALSVVCSATDSLYLASGAVANTLLFLFVSIPMADKRQSRKDGFDAYKKQTRMLLPIKKLKSISEADHV